MSATTEEKTSKKVWLSYIPLVLLALTFILPLLFMLFSSLKPKDQILSDLTTFRAFLPVGDLSLDNYVGVFNRVPVARFFLNSIIVTTTIVVLGLVVNSMAGFAIARLEGPTLVAHKIGQRRVQGRTKAGGQSQQRFARRRDNQARQAFEAAADHAARLLSATAPLKVVTGGDHAY